MATSWAECDQARRAAKCESGNSLEASEKKVFLKTAFVVGLSALTFPSVAQTVPAGNVSAIDAAKVAKPKKTCRSEDRTASHFAAKTCHTAEEWAAIDAESGTNYDDLQHIKNR